MNLEPIVEEIKAHLEEYVDYWYENNIVNYHQLESLKIHKELLRTAYHKIADELTYEAINGCEGKHSVDKFWKKNLHLEKIDEEETGWKCESKDDI